MIICLDSQWQDEKSAPGLNERKSHCFHSIRHLSRELTSAPALRLFAIESWESIFTPSKNFGVRGQDPALLRLSGRSCPPYGFVVRR
jgi:hypothetical protein